MGAELGQGAAGEQHSRYRERRVGRPRDGRFWHNREVSKGQLVLLPSAASLWKHLLLFFWGQVVRMNLPFPELPEAGCLCPPEASDTFWMPMPPLDLLRPGKAYHRQGVGASPLSEPRILSHLSTVAVIPPVLRTAPQ